MKQSKEERVELLTRIQNNDIRALNELLATQRIFVESFLKKKFTNINQTEVEDLTQDTLVKAARSIKTFNPEYSFSTWFVRIATNTAIDFTRKKQLDTISIHDGEDNENDNTYSCINELQSKKLTPEELLLNGDMENLKNSLLSSEKIPQKYRHLGYLRYVEQLSYDEIAKAVDSPLGTIKAQLNRFRTLASDNFRQEYEMLKP